MNLEASGSDGDSYLFRTTGANATLLELYANNAPNPRGTAFYNEIFRHLPSDTDLSVPKRLGINGVDFGFTGQKNNQHTLHDSVANLSKSTIQHHGDNLFALAKPLSLIDLNELRDHDILYDNYYGSFFTWSHNVNQFLILVAFFALVAATRAAGILPRQLVGPYAVSVGLLLATFFSLVAILLTLHFIRGASPFWPATIIPSRLILFTVPISIGLTFAIRFNQRWSVDQGLLGIWWFWWTTATLLSVFLPDASYIFSIPLVVATLAVALAQWTGERYRIWVYPLTLVLVVPTTLPKILILEQTLGYWLIIATSLFFTLLVSSLLPFADAGFQHSET